MNALRVEKYSETAGLDQGKAKKHNWFTSGSSVTLGGFIDLEENSQ